MQFYSKKRWKFRDGPVPGTGCRGYSRWFRHPRTLQEMKWRDELTRGKRRILPTCYDDIGRSDQKWNSHSSWKLNRKTQWK